MTIDTLNEEQLQKVEQHALELKRAANRKYQQTYRKNNAEKIKERRRIHWMNKSIEDLNASAAD